MPVSNRLKPWLGAAVVVAALSCTVALIVSASDSTPNTKTATKAAAPTMNGAIATNGLILRITNKDPFDWTNCQVGVNPSGVFDSGFIHEQDRIAAGAVITLPLPAFIDSRGTRFDPASQVPVLATISCLTPVGRADTMADLR